MQITIEWHWWFAPLVVFIVGMLRGVTYQSRGPYDFDAGLWVFGTIICVLALIVGHYV